MFDRFVVVDWSANSTPKRGRDSIWIAVSDQTGTTVSNPSTRAGAERMLVEGLATDARILLGVDFSLGYPNGTATALGLAGAPWEAMTAELSRMVTDDERNRNNRFEVASQMNARIGAGPGPFWGCPPSAATETLSTTKPPAGPIAEWRTVESVLRREGHRPFSSWQLLGAGAVGSQSLLGIPMIVRLQERFEGRLSVWPFDVELGAIVVAEVWPSLLPLDLTTEPVRDAAQVRGVVEWLSELDATGELDGLFRLDGVPPALHEAVVGEEGWVLGVRY